MKVISFKLNSEMQFIIPVPSHETISELTASEMTEFAEAVAAEMRSQELPPGAEITSVVVSDVKVVNL